ncbi:MAG: patatin-like phospholipase family protein, partial [Polyangiaceae bacterium]|nr:patatin-like phospholipase family protein [Polyangiaceae bacterium]
MPKPENGPAFPRRPKVAFVGTGGAARGIAHLGVLRACEELGIAP